MTSRISRKMRQLLNKELNDKLDQQSRENKTILDYISTVNQRAIDIDTRVVHTESMMANSGSVYVDKGEVIAKIFSGLKMYLDPRDLAVGANILVDRIWEENITKAWLACIKPNGTVFDVGANFGYYGALAAQHTKKKDSKVVFFEANPRLIPYIHKTLSINWLNEQSIIENLAVSDKKQTLTLNVLKDYIGCSSLHSLEHIDKYMHNKMDTVVEERIKIKSTTIDEYCAENRIKKIDLIKIDVEGFEEKVYVGMKKIVRASADMILFIEFTKDSYNNPQKFYEELRNDFRYMYLVSKDGDLFEPNKKDYDHIIGSEDDWVMPIFSKKRLVREDR